MATKKGGKKAGEEGRSQEGRKEGRNQESRKRRDNPNQQVTARTFHRRTQTSEADEALQKKRRDLQAKLVVSFCFSFTSVFSVSLWRMLNHGENIEVAQSRSQNRSYTVLHAFRRARRT